MLAIAASWLQPPLSSPSYSAGAHTLRVGNCVARQQTFTTIQSAVDAASDGDAIAICPGTYPEQVSITKSIALRGVRGMDAPQIVVPAGGLVQNTTMTDATATAAQTPGRPGDAGLGERQRPCRRRGGQQQHGLQPGNDRHLLQECRRNDQKEYGPQPDRAGRSPETARTVWASWSKTRRSERLPSRSRATTYRISTRTASSCASRAPSARSRAIP